MNKVYLVTKGCYSDYSVDRAFSTRDGAKRYIDQISKSLIEEDINIEEFELDDFSNIPFSGLTVILGLESGEICRKQSYDRVREDVFVNKDQKGDHKYHLFSNSITIDLDKVNIWGLKYPPRPYLKIQFDHTDKKRALKVASEKRAALIAIYGGIENLKEGKYNRETLAFEG